VSQEIIVQAIAIAEDKDLSKDSCSCNADVMSIVNDLRSKEQTAMGRNPYAYLKRFSRSTVGKIVRQITPVSVRNGSVQNASRQRALKDPRNAISCAASWSAVADGVPSGEYVYSWDECGVMLNEFSEKQKVKCTKKGRNRLREKNLAPAVTETKEKRRMFQLGLRKFS
jgi:hypothetical protein